MKTCFKYLLVLILIPLQAVAQYPPAAGLEGSTAVKNDSSIITGWAVGCEVIRGYIDISNPDLGMVSFGDPADATGFAEGNSAGVVSLGDGGSALLTFDIPVADGDGWDFAVFENAMNDTFLELAFVEVSSDGEIFFRFPAISLTDTSQQVPAFGGIDCTKINNLAGKYRQGYGTPFDLSELAGTPGLDLQRITHIRITDVVGSISEEFAGFDSMGRAVNDPWPTAFETGGFDLDGIAVINTAGAGVEEIRADVLIYPNPCMDMLTIATDFAGRLSCDLVDQSGNRIYSEAFYHHLKINMDNHAAGLYCIILTSEDAQSVFSVISIR
ncbi:MAG: T9SS type A sorting domain-containing protein [Bacteroidota bacterium]